MIYIGFVEAWEKCQLLVFWLFDLEVANFSLSTVDSIAAAHCNVRRNKHMGDVLVSVDLGAQFLRPDQYMNICDI